MHDEFLDKDINKLRIENSRLKESLVYYKTRYHDFSERFSMLVKNLPDIVYILDRLGNILFISKTIAAYGYSAEELVGSNIFNLIAKEDQLRAVWHINERRRGERKTIGFPIRLRRKNEPGSYVDSIPEDITSVPLFDLYAEGRYTMSDGNSLTFIGTLGIARDITMLPKATGSSFSTLDDYDDTKQYIPICSGCKRIRLADGEWVQLEAYLSSHCKIQMTHSICPHCTSRFYPDSGS